VQDRNLLFLVGFGFYTQIGPPEMEGLRPYGTIASTVSWYVISPAVVARDITEL